MKLPEPRKISREQLAGWIAEDEADLQRFHNTPLQRGVA